MEQDWRDIGSATVLCQMPTSHLRPQVHSSSFHENDGPLAKLPATAAPPHRAPPPHAHPTGPCLSQHTLPDDDTTTSSRLAKPSDHLPLVSLSPACSSVGFHPLETLSSPVSETPPSLHNLPPSGPWLSLPFIYIYVF